MKHSLATMFAAFMALTAPAFADSPVVVELFTSQGCSSCPPADKMLHALSERDDVIALALHVDYWDYIGWKDQFALPKFTKRQREYAALNNRRSIYTPQMIVNGVTSVVGAKAIKLSEAISEHAASPSGVDLRLSQNDNRVVINVDANGAEGPFVVQIVRYAPRSEVRITRGENMGKTLTYANVVTDWNVLGEWNGIKPLSMSTPLNASVPVVVIVQKQRFGPILAAARLR
jgi:hypothetical protein